MQERTPIIIVNYNCTNSSLEMCTLTIILYYRMVIYLQLNANKKNKIHQNFVLIEKIKSYFSIERGNENRGRKKDCRYIHPFFLRKQYILIYKN